MRYVDGGTLKDLGEEVSLEQRVRLSAQVADALHAAHRQGLLHRDVKPSNVLVEETADQELVPWVTDFGIAVRDEGETSAGSEFAGTPHFLPPERLTAGADVDRRADVYSLGVTMYQLFTGELPYAATELIDVLQQIRTEVPRPPREVMAGMPAELEAIVLACMARDPSARYPSARAVAEDLQRYLDGEVVEAYTASIAHRVSKFAVRHRRLLAVVGIAAVVLLIVLAIFAVTTSMQSQRIAREAETAQRVADFVIEMFENADPFGTEEPDRARGESVTVREALDRAREKLEADQELAAEPEIRARLLTSLGMVYKSLSLYDSAEPLLREALAARQEALGSEHLDVATSLANLGSTLYRTGDWEEAESMLRSSLTMQRRLSDTDNLEVAESLQGLANLVYDRGDTAEAEMLYKQSLDLYRRLLGTQRPEVADVLNDLALLYGTSGSHVDAERLYRESLAIRRQCLGDDHPAIASSLNNLGSVLNRKGDFEGAEAHYRESLALRRRLLGDRHLDVVQSLNNLAGCLRVQGDLGEAEQLLREALATARDLLGEEHHIVAIVLRSLASVMVTQGQALEAEELIRRAIDTLRQTYAADHGLIASAEAVLGRSLLAQGRYDQAERLLLRIYPIVRDQAGASSIAARSVLERLVELYDAWGKPEMAVEYRRLLAALEVGDPSRL